MTKNARKAKPMTEYEVAERAEWEAYTAENEAEVRRGEHRGYHEDDASCRYDHDVVNLDEFRLKARKPDAESRRAPATVYAGDIDATTRNQFTIGIDTSREFVPPDDLVEGLITRVSRTGIVGASGACKTFFLGELAACIGTGKPFAGHDVLRPGGFGYFSYEASGTLEPRWRGLERKYPDILSDSSGRAVVPYFPVARPLSLDSDRGWRAMKDTIKRMEDVSWNGFDMPLVAVAVDTVHASQMVLKENDSDAWARPLEWMLELSEDHQLAFIVSHHSGKTSDGPDGKTEGNLWRGSGAAPAALDNIIALKMNKREGKVTRRWAYLEKSKDGETGYIADIETRVHKIGHKSNGKAITTLTLDFKQKSDDEQLKDRAAAMERKAKEKAWTPTAPTRKLLAAIRLVAQEEGREVKLSSGAWSYTASQSEAEARFRSKVMHNASRDFKLAKAALIDHAGMEVDERMMTFSITTEKPIPIGALS